MHHQAWMAAAVAWIAPAWQHAAAEASQPDQHFAGCQELAFALVHLSLDHLPELHSTSNFHTQDWAGVNNWCRWLIVMAMQVACLQLRLSSILAQSVGNFLLLN